MGAPRRSFDRLDCNDRNPGDPVCARHCAARVYRVRVPEPKRHVGEEIQPARRLRCIGGPETIAGRWYDDEGVDLRMGTVSPVFVRWRAG